MFRLAGATGATDLALDGAHTSAEHQAKVFAAAFLIHDEDAARMASATEISEEFGVSLKAARICFDRLQQEAERRRSAERVRKSADDAIATLKGNVTGNVQKAYLSDPCVSAVMQSPLSRSASKFSVTIAGSWVTDSKMAINKLDFPDAKLFAAARSNKHRTTRSISWIKRRKALRIAIFGYIT
jgi:hypothetical protein